MNCAPTPLPTFFSPAGSKAGPPFAGVVDAPVAVSAGAAADDAVAGEVAATTAAALDGKPQPVLPFWVDAPGPEQIPDGPAQQPLAQSAVLRHWPPMNCAPTPLPTFFSPAGSNAGPPLAGVVDAAVVGAGEAAAARATLEIVSGRLRDIGRLAYG
jgi:hypothetical protein